MLCSFFNGHDMLYCFYDAPYHHLEKVCVPIVPREYNGNIRALQNSGARKERENGRTITHEYYVGSACKTSGC